MPYIYSLTFHNEGGEERHSYIRERDRDALHRSQCLDEAKKLYYSAPAAYDDMEPALVDLLTADPGSIDVMFIPEDLWLKLSTLMEQEGGELWWEPYRYQMTPSDFQAFILQNATEVTLATLTELIARHSAKST